MDLFWRCFLIASAKDIVQYIMFVVLIILNIMIFVNSIGLDCDDCIVEFKNTQMGGIQLKEPLLVAEVPMNDLHYRLVNEGYCIVRWDRVQGFVR